MAAAKGRPSDHPLIVHVANAAQVNDYASSVPAFAVRLIKAFWPGPLTLILPRKNGVAAAAAGGQDSIGLRCPAHPVALAFLKTCNTGVAGPSGGSAEKPVGLVHFAVATHHSIIAKAQRFGNLSRSEIRERATHFALEMVLAAEIKRP